MSFIKDFVRDVPVPRMVRIRQTFDAPEIADLAGTLIDQLAKPGVIDQVKPGMRIAIGVGSRGMAEIPTLVRVLVEQIKKQGGIPFVVPAMGSHGGATAEGQREVLAGLGVTEASAGCEILATMEVVQVGRLDSGLPVYMDKYAYEADGIVVINRVKPHTCFHGPNESGIVKIVTIGLGKQKGAESCHAYSFKVMAEHIVAMAEILLARTPVLFAVATVENAYDRISEIVAMPAKDLVETDRMLLLKAKERMPKFMFDQFDVLIVDQIGKDVSGDGMDPNITGRFSSPFATGGPEVTRIVVLDLTDRTHGNANGMGAADFTTRKMADKVDFPLSYVNSLTANLPTTVRLPVVLDDDREAILAAVKTSCARDLAQARVVRIKDTLHMSEIFISESMLPEARANSAIEILSSPAELSFDPEGNLI
jgi:hypothetical protein